MKLGVVGIVGLLLLTGCASSPSVENQVKLVEYGKCLDYMQMRNSQRMPSQEFPDYLTMYEDMRANACKQYRP
jgi:hypothetical protein